MILYDHHLISTNGINLHVVQSGPKDGRLVILLHGFPEFWYGWRHQIPYLAEKGYRVWAPDQRGYNISDKPEGIRNYNLDLLAADVNGLIDASGREKVYLVGHDWGAVVAWWTTLKYPQHVQKLVILNAPHPAVSARTMRDDPEQRRRSRYFLFFQLPWLPEMLLRANNWRVTVESLIKTSAPDTFVEEDIEYYREAWSQPGAFTSMLNWYRAVFQARPKSLPSPHIRVPIRILWGARDPFIIREAAEMSLKFLDNGELFYFENATHWIQHEEAEDVNRHLSEFLR
jgi:pimeloyl-ACP methyl ester carboxylesterase